MQRKQICSHPERNYRRRQVAQATIRTKDWALPRCTIPTHCSRPCSCPRSLPPRWESASCRRQIHPPPHLATTACGHPKSLRAECCPHRLQALNGLVVHLHHQLDGAAEKEDTGLDTERMTLWTTRGSEQRVSVLRGDESLALLTSTTTARKFSCSHRQGAYLSCGTDRTSSTFQSNQSPSRVSTSTASFSLKVLFHVKRPALGADPPLRTYGTACQVLAAVIYEAGFLSQFFIEECPQLAFLWTGKGTGRLFRQSLHEYAQGAGRHTLVLRLLGQG